MEAFRLTYFQRRGNHRDLQSGVISGDDDDDGEEEEEEEAVFLKCPVSIDHN